MEKLFKTFVFFTILVSVIFLNPSNIYSGEVCNRFAVIVKPAYVYQNIPRLSSSRGLIGKRIALLPPGVRIKLCRVQYIKIGFSKFPFYRIMFRSGRNMRFGWILPRTFLFSKIEMTSVVSVAFVEETLTNTTVKPKQIDDNKDFAVDLPGASNLFYTVYILLFCGVLFGMIGKTFFMYAENRFTTKELFIRFGMTFFLAPMAFGSLLQLDIDINGQKEFLLQMVNSVTTGFGFSSLTSFKQNKTGGKK